MNTASSSDPVPGGRANRDTDVRVITASDGVKLGVRVLPSVGPRRGTALCLHAMMVDHRTFRPDGNALPSVLQAAGFEVWLPDLRGRGRSPCPGGHSYDDLVERDMPALVESARAGGGRLVIVGHSLGGHVAIAAAIDGYPADRYVLIASNTWRPSQEPRRRRRIAKRLAMGVFWAASRGGHFPSQRIGMGPIDEPRAYVDDLCRFWAEDRWTSRSGRDWGAAMGTVDAPCLVLIAAGDALMGHADGARAWAEALPNAIIEVVSAADGLPRDPGHMDLVIRSSSRPIWDRIARFAAEGLP